MKDVTVSPSDYLLGESEHLRTLYRESAQETWTLERYAMAATALVWSWCAAHLDAPGFRLLIWTPVIITIVLGLRAWSIYRNMAVACQYLARLESALGLPEELGWERHLARHRNPLRIATAYLFWPLISSIAVVVALRYG